MAYLTWEMHLFLILNMQVLQLTEEQIGRKCTLSDLNSYQAGANVPKTFLLEQNRVYSDTVILHQPM